MAQLYYYCHYDGGPDFHLGRVVNSKDPHLTTEGMIPFIQKLFQMKEIVSGCGPIPGEDNRFFVLSPRMRVRGDLKTNGSPMFQVQVAVTMNDVKNFHHLMRQDQTEQQIAAAIRDSMKLDRSDKTYGFVVNMSNVSNVLNASYGSLLSGATLQTAETQTCLYTGKSLPDDAVKRLDQALGQQLRRGKVSGWLVVENPSDQKRQALLNTPKKVSNVLKNRVV